MGALNTAALKFVKCCKGKSVSADLSYIVEHILVSVALIVVLILIWIFYEGNISKKHKILSTGSLVYPIGEQSHKNSNEHPMIYLGSTHKPSLEPSREHQKL